MVRRAAIDAAGWLLFLAVVGIGAWGLSGRPFVLADAGGRAGASRPAAAGGHRGHFFPRPAGRHVLPAARTGAAAHGPWSAPAVAESPRGDAQHPDRHRSLRRAAACRRDALRREPGRAGEPARSAADAGYHSVFIPVDEKQQPTHGKYFLPEPFFAELYRRAALQAEKPQGWMIASAVYRAALADDAAQAGHVVDRLTAEFEIRVFNAAARVRIPLRREEVSLEPGQAQLDDRAVQPEWEPDGSALLLEIAEPGEYRLELTLRPTVQPGSRACRLRSGDSPRAHRAARVQRADGRPAGRVPLGLGRSPLGRSPVALDRRTGAQPTASPPPGRMPPRPGAAAAVDVEQLLWLKIEPGCVLLDVRMKAKAASGQLRRLLVRADSALELLPSTGPAVPAVQTRGGGDSLADLRNPMAATRYRRGRCRSAATFDLHFLCSGASSLGTFRVPQIDVVDARPVRRSLAVSIDPALEYQMPGGAIAGNRGRARVHQPLGRQRFAPPEMAFRLNGNAAEWNLVTRARRAETSGDQNVTWSFNAQTAELQFDAQLTTAAGSVFQYRLEAPPTLHVDSIAVLAEGANHAARWSQDQDGQRQRLSRQPRLRAPRAPASRPDAAAEETQVGVAASSAGGRANPELAGQSLPPAGCPGRGLRGRRVRGCQDHRGRCRPRRSGAAGAVVLRRSGRRLARAGNGPARIVPAFAPSK